uniref:C2H2-type domain-containing protein n=1 Tax=viral metagenome TaxID=1070528 RepID=A0A6C0JGS1_9ZZZZ
MTRIRSSIIREMPPTYPNSPVVSKSPGFSCIDCMKSFKLIASLHVSFKYTFRLNLLFVVLFVIL